MTSVILIGIIASLLTCFVVHGSFTVRKITIATNGNDTETCLSNSSRPCRSVGYVLSSHRLNNTSVNIKDGVYALNKTVYIDNVTGLNITGKGGKENPIILCNGGSSSGIVFRRCSNINLVTLEFQMCGSKFNSSSRINGSSVLSYTAILMEDSKHVAWTGVKVSNSSGLGSVFYDVTGKVEFNNVTFESNAGRMVEISNESLSLERLHNTGGAIYIEFRPKASKESGIYLFKYCKFLKNIADNKNNDVISDSIGQSYFSLGRGGAISFNSRGDCQGNQLIINTCLFSGNRALWGAGIFGEFNDRTGNNSIRVINSNFTDNQALFAGGGIRIGVNSNNEKGSNTIKVQGSVFNQNQAQIGGAFSEYQILKQSTSTVLIKNCTFDGNPAKVGSDMHLQNLNATLIDVTITKSKARNQMYLIRENEQGSLYCFLSHILLQGYNLIKGALKTGFVLDFCNVILNGTSNFTGNSGVNGGAITMYGHSKIRFTTDSKLILHNNTATNKGGAIYVETPVPLNQGFNSTQLNIYKCFFIFGDTEDDFKDADGFNTTIDFWGNTAPLRGGDNVWATTIWWCRGKNEPNINNTALKWKIIKSNGENFSTNKTVITSPCSIVVKKEQWNAYPGIPIHVHLTLRDENWNTVNGTVRIKAISKNYEVSASSSEVDFTVNKNTSLLFKGKPGSAYNISLTTLDRFSVFRTIKDRKLKDCPLGFHLNNQTCYCQSVNKGVTSCNLENQSVYIIPSRWGNAKNNKEFAKHVCPLHYCRKCIDNGIGCLFDEKKQCAEGRDPTSTLCSKCRPNFSVHLGSEICTECKNDMGILWLALFMVILTIIVFFIMLVNLDAYSTYLNGFLYSYQIIPLLMTDEEYIDAFISLLIAVSNVSGTGKIQKGFCIWKGMNDMQKLLLNYLAPTYLILCTAAFGAFSSVCRKCPFNRKATFRAFVFISLIAYADFTKLSFMILRPVKVDNNYYAYFAAYMPYFGKEHAPYAVIALLISIFIVIGFPITLLFPYYITRYPRFVRLMGIFDTFQQPFKKEPYISRFAAFYFINRFVLLMIKTLMENGPVQDVVFGMMCVVILVFFIVYTPYIDWQMNFFDGLQLANIVFMAITFTGVTVAYENDVRKSLKRVNWALAYVPLACLLYRIIAWGWKKIPEWKTQREASKLFEVLSIFNAWARGRESEVIALFLMFSSKEGYLPYH